jgi:VIT1/CCC1 family predicted Fe2+/Mn2+ transporter
VGADLSPAIILIIGFSNMLADGFSMAGGNFLGTRSEKDFYRKEEQEEYREIKEIPERERQEVRDILVEKGYEGAKLEQMVALISGNEKFWVEFMMLEELKLYSPEDESPSRNAAITFASFVVAGVIPLVPYVAFGQHASFLMACVFSGAALFVIGALRAYFSPRSAIALGLEMLAVGGVAAAIAYGMGYMLQALISTG